MTEQLLDKSPHSLIDDVGIVYLGDTKVFRAINEEHIGEVRKLLHSGLLDQLVSAKLFPMTVESSLRIPGYSMVLEHEKVSPLIYPYEWSPEMLRRAGLCVLEINKIANEFGYQLKDAHPYNIMFKYGSPLFVDFGSFISHKSSSGWTAYKEFLACYYYPLKLYSQGFRFVFRHLFLLSGRSLPLSELVSIAHPSLRIIPQKYLEKVIQLWIVYKNFSQIQDDQIFLKIHSKYWRNVASFVKNNERLPFKKINLVKLKDRLNSLNFGITTQWGDYQQRSGFYSSTGIPSLSSRFMRVLEIIAELKPRTVLELAGNQGILSRQIAKLPYVHQIVCSDYDESAIDKLLQLSQQDERVTPAVFNLIGDSFQEGYALRCVRLKSELVIALAVIHHLILTQGYSIDIIIEKVLEFSSRYIILEFMPLGLWDGQSAPALPCWYTEQWFEDNLRKHCNLLRKEKIEENRILYLAELG